MPAGVLRNLVATTVFRTTSNLDASALVGQTFDTPVQIFDSLGSPHVLTATYTRTVAGWDFDMTVPGADVIPVSPLPVSVLTGSVAFDGTGQVSNITVAGPATGGGAAPAVTDVLFTAPAWANGATAGPITWDVAATSART